ncbi:MAG TPA: 5-formyltetrahydrofolate cyclo-ligase [Thermodesulfovibrionales bacterium]|jgi:5-formyltetrahydrofolate cyclo-ligase|nr:5-formyltetrahydrofolate cyclo-ligase [Thermodesulfovibrionales bacterium]
MKKEIRNKVLEIRNQIPLDIRTEKDLHIRETLFSLPEFLSAKAVLFYASFRSEVETLSLIRESLAMGKKVLLPKVDTKNSVLTLYEIKNMNELAPGYMGIPEPDLPAKRSAVLDDVDLAIIPGVAFDLQGNRLGYGAGYYDNLLSGRGRKIPIIALAYEEQLVAAIPSEKHDVRVNLIVTDKRVIRIP